MLDIQTQIKKHAIFLLCGVLCGATERLERKKPAYKAGEMDGELDLSHIIQHNICRDARNHIYAAEFIAGVLE